MCLCAGTSVHGGLGFRCLEDQGQSWVECWGYSGQRQERTVRASCHLHRLMRRRSVDLQVWGGLGEDANLMSVRDDAAGQGIVRNKLTL